MRFYAGWEIQSQLTENRACLLAWKRGRIVTLTSGSRSWRADSKTKGSKMKPMLHLTQRFRFSAALLFMRGVRINSILNVVLFHCNPTPLLCYEKEKLDLSLSFWLICLPP